MFYLLNEIYLLNEKVICSGHEINQFVNKVNYEIIYFLT